MSRYMVTMHYARKAKQMLYRSFLKGFGRGLAAPGLLLEPYDVRRDEHFEPSVEKAWQDVGDALRDAMSREGASIGTKSRATGKVRQARRHYRIAAE